MKNSFRRHTVISSRDDDTSSKAGYKKKKEKAGGGGFGLGREKVILAYTSFFFILPMAVMIHDGLYSRGTRRRR
jgi:hypothetical protein